ncbi:YbbR-like domain-containing protein [Thermodesulfobacteriota bacterium]
MILKIFKLALVLCLVSGLMKALLPADVHASETQIKVPVVPQNLPSGTMVTGPLFQGIEIHVRGPAALLSTLPGLKLQYLLDLAGMQTGNHTVPIQVARLNLPQGLSIVSIQPPSIQVHLESEARKDVAVIVFFKGNPATGYFVAKTTAVPGRVLLRGPKQALDTRENISTHPIDVSGASESFKKEITLNLSEDIEVVTPKTPIMAEITILEEILTKSLPNIAVQGNDSQHAYEITPPVITIDVKGPAKLLESLSSTTGFRVYVDIKGLDPGVYVRRATLELPVEITLISASPEIFTVRIGK